MQCLIDSLIYLLAIMGIIFTSMTFFEMFTQKIKDIKCYKIFSKVSGNNKKIDIMFDLENLTEEEEIELVKKIKKEKNINLKEIANNIYIQKNE